MSPDVTSFSPAHALYLPVPWPPGDFLWWGDTAGSLTDRSWRVLLDLPPLPPSFPYHTMYPHTATIALLALRPDNEYAPSFVIFGGTVGPGGRGRG